MKYSLRCVIIALSINLGCDIVTALYIILALLAVAFVACTVVGAVGFRKSCVSQRIKKPETDPKRIKRAEVRKANNAYMYSLQPEDLSLVTPDGLTLRAWYTPAEKLSKRFVIGVHGHNCNGPDECSHILRFYRNTLGYNYLLPDLRGHGRSDGKLIGFGALDSKDIRLWIDYLIERFGEDIEIILYGISMGAATVMLVNEQNPPEQVKLVIEDCGYTNAFEECCREVENTAGFKADFIVRLINIYCRLISKYDLKKDADPLGKMRNAANPVLFIHGAADTFVPSPMCRRLYDACPTAKDIMLVDGAVHAFSYYDAKDAYEKKITEFICANLGQAVVK